MSWEQIYDYLGIRDFIYFISSPDVQDAVFPVKIIFILFSAFFFCAVIYFYINSSYIKYQFLQDTAEFLSWQPHGLREINKRWKKIMKKMELGNEYEYKLAIIEADDFLYQTLENRGYKGESFEELLNNAGKKSLSNFEGIVEAHKVRNSIVYNTDYKLDIEKAKNILADYENAIKRIASS